MLGLRRRKDTWALSHFVAFFVATAPAALPAAQRQTLLLAAGIRGERGVKR